MAHTHSADQRGDSGRVKDISDHAVRLALIETAFGPTCDDAAGILAAMLEKRESLADLRSCVDGRVVEEQT